MECNLVCTYSSCSSPSSISCTCSPNFLLLCQEHAISHIKELPDKVHAFKDICFPIEPHEKEAFHSAKIFLLQAEEAKKEDMTRCHSHKLGKVVQELSDLTKKLLRELEDLIQTDFRNLAELSKNVL